MTPAAHKRRESIEVTILRDQRDPAFTTGRGEQRIVEDYGPSYEITGDGHARLELEKETFLQGAFPEAVLNGLRSRG
jgi:hypothetical protein